MATGKSAGVSDLQDQSVSAFELTLVERLYVKKALDLLKASLDRGLKNEVPGSEVYAYRTKESSLIRDLSNRFGG